MKTKKFIIEDRALALMVHGSLCQRGVTLATTMTADGPIEFEVREAEIKRVTKLNEVWDFTSTDPSGR